MVHVSADVAARLKLRFLLAGLRLMGWLTRVVDRRRAEPACCLAGALWWAGGGARRGAVRANLRQMTGREPGWRDVLRVFQHGVLNYWDTFALAHLTGEQVLALMPGEGWEHLDRALASGRGAVVVSAHLSSVTLCGTVIAARGYPTTCVVERMQPARLHEAVNRYRRRFGLRAVAMGGEAAREMIALLRRGEVAGLIADRDVEGTGPLVEFFGAPTSFPDGPAALSLRTGAPLIVAVASRRPDGGFHGTIDPPLDVPRTGDRKRDVAALTQAMAWRLQYHIGSHPEQWTVFQKRWPA